MSRASRYAPSRGWPRWKRPMDVLVAALGGALASPLILVGLAQSRATLNERPIFRQQRVGLGGKSFGLLKIRTMPSQIQSSSTVTLNNDGRVPPELEWIRDYKVDELPQIWNVLKGDMSIVGPRPTVADDVSRMDERARRRHDVRPGLTGLSQIRGNAALSWPQRIEYDLEYVESKSIMLDLKIIWSTVLAVIRLESSSAVETGDEWSVNDANPSHRR